MTGQTINIAADGILASTWWTSLTVAAVVGAGAVGGVLYAFSAFVMSGLDRTEPRTAVAAMNEINRAALRPPLLIPITGTLLMCLALLVFAIVLIGRGEPGGVSMLLGCVLYIASFVVTMRYHMPRNDALLEISPTGPDADSAWRHYVPGWVAWNHVRSASSLGGSLCLLLALLR